MQKYIAFDIDYNVLNMLTAISQSWVYLTILLLFSLHVPVTTIEPVITLSALRRQYIEHCDKFNDPLDTAHG